MKKSVVRQRLLYQITKKMLFQFVVSLVFSSVVTANIVNRKPDTKNTVTTENLTLANAYSETGKYAYLNFLYNSAAGPIIKGIVKDSNGIPLSGAVVLVKGTKIAVVTDSDGKFTIEVPAGSNKLVISYIGMETKEIGTKNLNPVIILTKEGLNIKTVVVTKGYEKTSAEPIIKGVVMDSNGIPLPGATVLIKGTKIAVVTDSDGKFTIEVPAGSNRLVISYIGMETKEIGTGNHNPTIVLTEEGQNLKEVVVTTGYEKTSKRTFTGAISKISGAELKVDGVIDISRMIEGKAAGVIVQNVTGSFGSTPKITVRGSSSIFGDTKPLWVIDGVVQEDIINLTFADLASGNSATLLSSAVAGLNANDIQSIEILKDASATSIYGSRSLNGVVVVTTKQGRRDSPLRVSYIGEATVRLVPNYSQYDILNSQESMSVFQEMRTKGYLDQSSSFVSRFSGVYGILAREINHYDVSNGQYGVRNEQPYINEFLKKYELANTNWFKVLFRPSVTQNHSLSFSGGGKNNIFYASLGFYEDPGWTIADNVKQLSSNLKGTFFINDKLNVTLSTLGSFRDQQSPGSYESKIDDVNGEIARDFDINPFSYVLSTSRALRPYDENGNLEYYRSNWAPMNIINELKNNTLGIKVTDIRFQADLEYKVIKNLTYNFIGSARYANTSREHRILEGSNVVGAYNAGVGNNVNAQIQNANTFLFRDPDDFSTLPVSVLPNGGILRKFTNDLTSYNIRNSVTYKDIFKEKHEVEGFFGTELRSVDRNNDNFTAAGIQYGEALTSFIEPRFIKKLASEGNSYYEFGKERERTVGFFGKIGYTYNRRYTGSITGRYDGSNRQGSSSTLRWLPTYTFSGKWNIREEGFMKNNETFNTLALRVSYGLTATTGPATNSLPIYKSSVTDRFNPADRENIINIQDLQNRDLTWEKQFETNIGLDLGIVRNRLQVAIDVYSRQAFDLIDFVITSGIGGQGIKQGNNADMNTKGLEIGFTSQNIVTDNFKWTTNVSLSVYDQKITKLANKPSVFDLIAINGGNTVGHPRNSLYSYQFTGLNILGLPTFKLQDGAKNNITEANFQDTNDVTKYLKYEGSVEPNKSVGFANTFTYKNWSLYVFFVGSAGNKVRLNPAYSNVYSDQTVFTKEFSNRWLNPGDENVTNIPVIADKILNRDYDASKLQVAYNTYNFSDVRIASGDFVRLKNISLSWEFPKEFKKMLRMTMFNLKASAVNPWLIYSDKNLHGQDPEFRNTGGVAFPVTTQYSFSINISF